MKWKRKTTLISILVSASLLGAWMIFGGTGLPEVANRSVSYDIDDGHDTTLGGLFDTQLTGRGGNVFDDQWTGCLRGPGRLAQMAECSIYYITFVPNIHNSEFMSFITSIINSGY